MDKEDIVFILTVVFSVCTLFLTAAVISVFVRFRRLKKKSNELITKNLSRDISQQNKATVTRKRPKNKYEPSVRNNDERIDSFYDSPPLREDQNPTDWQGIELKTFQDQEEQENPVSHEDESYIVCIADDEKLPQSRSPDTPGDYIDVLRDTPTLKQMHSKQSSPVTLSPDTPGDYIDVLRDNPTPRQNLRKQSPPGTPRRSPRSESRKASVPVNAYLPQFGLHLGPSVTQSLQRGSWSLPQELDPVEDWTTDVYEIMNSDVVNMEEMYKDEIYTNQNAEDETDFGNEIYENQEMVDWTRPSPRNDVTWNVQDHVTDEVDVPREAGDSHHVTRTQADSNTPYEETVEPLYMNSEELAEENNPETHMNLSGIDAGSEELYENYVSEELYANC